MNCSATRYRDVADGHLLAFDEVEQQIHRPTEGVENNLIFVGCGGGRHAVASKMHSISTAMLPGSDPTPDGAAGADAGVLAEDVRHQFGKAVDDLRLILIVGRAVDHAQRLDQAFHFIERTERVAHGAEDVQADESSGFFALLGRQIGADPARHQRFVLGRRPRAGNIEQTIRQHGRLIFGHRFGSNRQSQSQFLEASFRFGRHGYVSLKGGQAVY